MAKIIGLCPRLLGCSPMGNPGSTTTCINFYQTADFKCLVNVVLHFLIFTPVDYLFNGLVLPNAVSGGQKGDPQPSCKLNFSPPPKKQPKKTA